MAKRRAKGEGSIFKENTGYWCAKIRLPNGKDKRKRSRSQKAVREWLLEQRKALQANLLVKDEKITVGEYLDSFMDNVAAHSLADSTIFSYNYLIQNHVKPRMGHVRLVNLRPDHIQTLYSEKLNEGLSKRTVQYIHAVLRRSLNQAVKWGLLYRNPTDAVTVPAPKTEPPNTLTADQAKLFLKSVEDHRWYPLYVLAITTGMRKGELLGLHWEDINLDRGTISVTHNLVTVQGKQILGQPKSSKAKRTIALPKLAQDVLREYQLVEGYVFATSSGRPISQRNLTRHFHLALEKLGFPRIRFHDLRHTAATLLLQANVHPKVVQEMLGHSSIILTLDTYSHVIPSMQEEAANEMDKLLSVPYRSRFNRRNRRNQQISLLKGSFKIQFEPTYQVTLNQLVPGSSPGWVTRGKLGLEQNALTL